jgi:hypothetical protein
MSKPTLPKYAYWYDHPAAQHGDLYASFYEDEGGGTITVGIQRGDGDTFYLYLSRGGLDETRFTQGELAKVSELISLLSPKTN